MNGCEVPNGIDELAGVTEIEISCPGRPFPDSLTLNVPSCESVSTEKTPVAGPADIGAKTTPMLQAAPASTELPQLLVCIWKTPVMVTPDTCKTFFVLFDSVTTAGALAVVTS